MAKQSSTKATQKDEADPRFEPVVRALAGEAGFSLMESQSRAMRGMLLNGKSFGMSSHGRFILKMNEERAKAHITQGTARPFSPAAGRIMKGWIEVTHPKADWVALAREAHLLAAGTAKPAARRVAKKRPRSSKP